MDDERFERRLEGRLRAYEDRLADAPMPARSTAGRLRGWPVLIAGSAAAAAAIALAVAVISSTVPAGVGDGASPGASLAPPSAPTEATASPAASAAPRATPLPTEQPTAAPTPAPSAETAVPSTWTVTGTFTSSETRHVVEAMVEWGGELLAFGTRYASTDRSVFGPPPTPQGVVWRSTDGTSWSVEDVTALAGVEPTHAFETRDGALVVLADRWDTDDPSWDVVTEAWQTVDGRSWEPYRPVGLEAPTRVADVAVGVRGYIATVSNAGAMAVYHSSDGRSWRRTLEVTESVSTMGAGDEGFVVAVLHTDGTATSSRMMASADGLEWFEGDSLPSAFVRVAPRGPDWIAVVADEIVDRASAPTITTYRSSNGLTWSPIGTASLARADDDLAECVEAPDDALATPTLVVVGTMLSYGCSEGGVINAGSSHGTTSGRVWSQLPIGSRMAASAMIELDGRLILAADTRTGAFDLPEIGVTFWAAQLP